MPITTTITAPDTGTVGEAVTFTAESTGQDTRKTLNGGIFTIDRNIPYEFSVTRKDGTITNLASIADNTGVVGAYPVSPDWIRGNDGVLVYGNDNQIIEGI